MKIVIGNIYSTVTECSTQEREYLNTLLTCDVPGHKFMKAFKNKQWDGKKRFFSEYSHTFLSGFLPFIAESFARKKWIIRATDTRKDPYYDIDEPFFNRKGLRWYQKECIEAFLDNTITLGNKRFPWIRGVLKIPTRGGKTATATRLIDALNVKTLYVVERLDALYQSQKEFQEWSDLPTGIIGDGKWEPAQVTFCMIQTLRARMTELKKFVKDITIDKETEEAQRREKILRKNTKALSDFFRNIQFLLYDEVHKLDDNNTYHKIMLQCPNAYYHVGISGTPLSRGDLGDTVLVGTCGEIVYEVSRKTLENQGFISKARVLFFPITKPIDTRAKYVTAYQLLLVENELRNNLIVKHVKILLKKGCTIFVLTRILKHGKILMDLLAEAGVDAVYVSGKDKTEKRQKVLAGMGTMHRVVVVSSIFDDSIDVQQANAAIIASGGRSRIRSIQRSSRVLTKRVSGDNVGWIVDYIDRTNKHLLSHSLERLSTYKNEGFSIREMSS